RMRDTVEDELEAALGGEWRARPLRASGFCDTWEARSEGHRLFVKSGLGPAIPMLRAEADGLRALRSTGTIRVPKVRAWAERPGWCVLAMQWLDFVPPDAGFGARLGEALAALHAAPHEGFFGWPQDNYIGATPQPNAPTHGATGEDWCAFFASERLGAMLERLEDAALAHAVERVLAALPQLLAGHAPTPALVHGDLWHGNWGMLPDGAPVLYDPAVAYTDPEAELAMMDLFGVLPAGFTQAYESAGGVRADPRRKRLYQLYHLLNHVVLFGAAYRQQALDAAGSLA
ncbi:MAG TPA: fructosamine kinase family protein, partial [Ramlibacter sp.]|nr:fructosamine kinase family protein [Ramlibacter sp.]